MVMVTVAYGWPLKDTLLSAEASQTYSFANLEHQLWVLTSRWPTQSWTFNIFSSQTHHRY